MHMHMYISTSPLVRDNVSIAWLEGQLNGVVSIVHVIEEQGLATYHNTHLQDAMSFSEDYKSHV